jgi:glycine betaine/choline ABC-type transport system substrate-binding protein
MARPWKNRVFISYIEADREKAYQICEGLESRGLDCWIAPRDIEPGEGDWADAIVRAISNAQGFILVLSRATSESKQVSREVHLASELDLTIVPLRIENFSAIEGGLSYFIGTQQYLDAFDRPLDDCLDELASALGHEAIIKTPAPRPKSLDLYGMASTRRAVVLLGGLMLSSAAAAGFGLHLVSRWTRKGTVTIEGKPFIESSILVEIMAIMIEKEGEEGGTRVQVKRNHWRDADTIFRNLLLGYADLMPEYSGILLVEQLGVSYADAKRHEEDNNWIREVLRQSKRGRSLAWLDGFGYESDYAIVMLKSKAVQLGLLHPDGRPATISDLARVARKWKFEVDEGKREKRLRIGIDHKFASDYRQDGYYALLKAYDIRRDTLKLANVSHERKFEELKSGGIDITDAFTTDPDLYKDAGDIDITTKDSPYTILRDDLNFFLRYSAAPLARIEIIDSYPEVQRALKRLAGTISLKNMVRWIEVIKKKGIDGEELGRSESARARLTEVCSGFLREKHLLASTRVTANTLHSM